MAGRLTEAPSDEAVAAMIRVVLDARDAGATACPSDVARALAPGDAAAWRALMPQVREVAARLAAEGRLRVTRGGVDFDALDAQGPIRLGRP